MQTSQINYCRKVNNTFSNPVSFEKMDESHKCIMVYHMEREGNGIKIVEDGLVDRQKLLESEKVNAGLENIIRLQTMRYGTIENAIKRNADKQVYADVSKLPTSVAEQAEFISKTEAEVASLCSELGISKEDLLKSNVDTLSQLIAAKKAANNGEGGVE